MRQVAQRGAGATGAGPHLAFRFCGVAVRPCCTASPNVTGPGTHTAPQAGGVCAWLGPQPAPRVSERVPGPLPAGPLGPCPRLRLLGQRGLRRRVACVHGPPILSVTARVSGGRTRTVRARPRGRKGAAGRAVPQDSGARVTNAGRPRRRGTLPEAGQGRALWPHASDGWLCSGSPVVGGGLPRRGPRAALGPTGAVTSESGCVGLRCPVPALVWFCPLWTKTGHRLDQTVPRTQG